MKTFIGAKIIQAEFMTQEMFQRDIKKNPSWDTYETKPGYHVVYANPNGSEYHSWSPADVFENAYRELTDGEIEFIKKSGGE